MSAYTKRARLHSKMGRPCRAAGLRNSPVLPPRCGDAGTWKGSGRPLDERYFAAFGANAEVKKFSAGERSLATE